MFIAAFLLGRNNELVRKINKIIIRLLTMQSLEVGLASIYHLSGSRVELVQNILKKTTELYYLHINMTKNWYNSMASRNITTRSFATER